MTMSPELVSSELFHVAEMAKSEDIKTIAELQLLVMRALLSPKFRKYGADSEVGAKVDKIISEGKGAKTRLNIENLKPEQKQAVLNELTQLANKVVGNVAPEKEEKTGRTEIALPEMKENHIVTAEMTKKAEEVLHGVEFQFRSMNGSIGMFSSQVEQNIPGYKEISAKVTKISYLKAGKEKRENIKTYSFGSILRFFGRKGVLYEMEISFESLDEDPVKTVSKKLLISELEIKPESKNGVAAMHSNSDLEMLEAFDEEENGSNIVVGKAAGTGVTKPVQALSSGDWDTALAGKEESATLQPVGK